MARLTRRVLDLTLYSIRTARPVISTIWDAAKSKLMETRAKNLVDNRVVTKFESILDSVTSIALEKLTYLRDLQLPGEKRYLEKELSEVKKKLGETREESPPSGGQSSSGKGCEDNK